MQNRMKLSFLSLSENESFARAAAGAFASQLNPTIDEITDIKTAVSEAVTNAIVHGYRSKIAEITMEIFLEGQTVRIVIEDRGIGIADVRQAREPFYSGAPGEERSGMGFTVMETFMDTLEVHSQLDVGTVVTMTKKIEQKSDEAVGTADA